MWDATEEGLDDQMRWFREEIGDLCIEVDGEKYVIRGVDALKVMGAIIKTSGFHECFEISSEQKRAKLCGWTWVFSKNTGNDEWRKHRRYREVVQSRILLSCHGWSWNKWTIDALHGWEIRNLDLMSLRRWSQTGLSLKWFRANQIRKARQIFVELWRWKLEYLLFQRIWECKEKIIEKKETSRRTTWRGEFWLVLTRNGEDNDPQVRGL